MNRFLIAAAIVGLVPGSALAQEPDSLEFEIALTVESTGCTMSIGDLDLGSALDDDPNPTRGSFELTIDCPVQKRARVAMSYGQNPMPELNLNSRRRLVAEPPGPAHYFLCQIRGGPGTGLSFGFWGDFDAGPENYVSRIFAPGENVLEGRVTVLNPPPGDENGDAIAAARPGRYSDVVAAKTEY